GRWHADIVRNSDSPRRSVVRLLKSNLTPSSLDRSGCDGRDRIRSLSPLAASPLKLRSVGDEQPPIVAPGFPCRFRSRCNGGLAVASSSVARFTRELCPSLRSQPQHVLHALTT